MVPLQKYIRCSTRPSASLRMLKQKRGAKNNFLEPKSQTLAMSKRHTKYRMALKKRCTFHYPLSYVAAADNGDQF